MEFKLDVEEDWDSALMQRLASLDRVRVVDLKAYYRGTSVDLAPDPALYRAVVEALPDVVIEDPWLEDGCREALAGAEDRLSFDAPVHSLADLDRLPLEPRWLNVKPSRFGTVRGLLETIDACEERGIRMYGGGQYELGPGRGQIQRLASVFYAGRAERRRAVRLQRGRPAGRVCRRARCRLRRGRGCEQRLRRARPGERALRLRPRSFGPGLGEGALGRHALRARTRRADRPYHWHVGEEEWLVVVAGTPTLRTPEGEQRARAVGRRRSSRAAPAARTRSGTTTDASARVAMLSTVQRPRGLPSTRTAARSRPWGWTDPDTADRVLIGTAPR